MKGFTRSIGKPIPKKGYSLQYTTDYFGNEYHRYMPITSVRIYKDNSVKELMAHRAMFYRMLRLFIITMVVLGLLYWSLIPKEYINPLAEHHNSRLNPVTFNEFTPKYLGAEPMYAKEVKKDKSEIEKKILNAFGEYGDEMLICMKTENGKLNPKALPNWNKNGTRDFGLMRINSVHCARHGLTQGDECKEFFEDIDNNLAEGKRIFDARKHGFSAWYAPSCKQFHYLVTK